MSILSLPGLTGPAANLRVARPLAGGPTAAAPVKAPAGEFGAVLAGLAKDAVATLKEGEAASLAAIQGKGSLQQAVGAVMAAEQSLNAAIALRDKAVAAYQEISRMAI